MSAPSAILATSFLQAADLPALRTYLEATTNDVGLDGFLVDAVNAALGVMEKVTGRKLAARTATNVLLDGTGEVDLFLPEFPVSAVSGVQVAVDGLFDGTVLELYAPTAPTATAGYQLDAELGILTRRGTVWIEGRGTVLVGSVTAGVASGTADWEALKHAQRDLVRAAWFRVGKNPALISQSLAGISEQYLTAQGDQSARSAAIPPEARAVLDGFRAFGLAR